MTKTTNLGVVKAIFVGISAPSNHDVVWKDTSLAVPLLKWYNTTSSTWVPLTNSVLIDNITIKIDVDGKIYVDSSAVSAFVLADGSVTLLKQANVASGTVFYRKATGSGAPQVQTLATLKADLGLIGSNTGDQNLTVYALKSYVINGHLLNGNFDITPAEIGSPSGSGNSTGTNTGDEDKASILTKLEVLDVIDTLTLTAALDLYVLKVEDKSLILDSEITRLSTVRQIPYIINLPANASVAGRVAAASAPTNYPTGWVLVAAGGLGKDLSITHTLTGRKITNVTVESVDGTRERFLKPFYTAYSGAYGDGSVVMIEGLAPTPLAIRINLFFD